MCSLRESLTGVDSSTCGFWSLRGGVEMNWRVNRPDGFVNPKSGQCLGDVVRHLEVGWSVPLDVVSDEFASFPVDFHR